MIKFNGAVLLALSIAVPHLAPACRAEANSAPPYWEGSDASGVLVTGGQCPVVVEKEMLSVRIPEFPKVGGTEEDYASYSATVTADYTFYNPEGYDVSATLLFPSMTVSSYAFAAGEDVPPSVTVDGERAEFRIRHSYLCGDFDIDEDMRLVTEGERQDDFYAPELPVTEYNLAVTPPEGDGYAYLHLTLDCNPLRTRLLLENCPYAGLKNGYTQLTYRLDGGKTHTVRFFVAGEDVSVIAYKFTREKTDTESLSGGNAEIAKRKLDDFRALAMLGYREEYGIGETDWYNGFVDMLNGYCASHKGMGCIVYYDCNMTRASFTEWYEYRLEIPAGGRVRNTVTAPLFPSIDGRSNPRYVYTYLLSPAQKWADFKEIEIEIETPFHLESSTLDFVKEGEVYRFSRNALPQGELTFTLTETENLSTGTKPYLTSRLMPKMQRTILIVCALAALAIGITAVSLVRVKERRRSAKSQTPEKEKNKDKK